MDTTEKRRRWIVHKRLEGWKVQDRRAGLQVKSHRPHTIHRTSREMVNLVLQLRRTRNWGPCRIEGYLRNYHTTSTSHTTIHRILVQAGLNNPLQKPRQRRSYRRWQRRHPSSLWQCDLKQAGARWLITTLDDHSKFLPACEHFTEGITENVIWLLDKAIHEYAKPREMLTDHGSQFWSVRRGESRFDRYCQQQGVKHILGGIGKPTTLGKIERWFLTYDLEHARFPLHREFVEYYNWERPRMALDYSTPAEVHFRDVGNVL